MANGDSRNGFFYPTLTLMIDSYSMLEWEMLKRVPTIHTRFISGCRNCFRVISSLVKLKVRDMPLGTPRQYHWIILIKRKKE